MVRHRLQPSSFPGNHQTYLYALVVTTTDLMFRKIFELLWFDKLHVEMDLVWFWRKLWCQSKFRWHNC